MTPQKTTNRTIALLTLAADQILADIAEYEQMLECAPRASDNPDDKIAVQIFTDLLRERRAMLARLHRLELNLGRTPEAA